MSANRFRGWVGVSFVLAAVPGSVACHSETDESRAADAAALDGGDDAGTYSYSGCPPAANAGCFELMKTLSCAVDTIAREHAACSTAADCVAAPVLSDCSGLGICDPFVVGRGAAPDFIDQAQAEITRFCRETHCHGAPLCGGQTLTFVCVDGTCGTAPCDSGTCDWSN